MLCNSSNFPVKLIFWGILVFVCLDKFIWVHNVFDDIVSWHFDKYFLRFLFFFTGWSKNGLLLINKLKSFISINGIRYSSKELLVGPSFPFLNERTNNLLMFLQVGSIRSSKLVCFFCVVISDLYLFQEIVLLYPCFIFSINLILSLID